MSEWKNNLELLEALSSEPLNKNQAWNKLFTRLESKPRRKNRWIYWMAAACLVIAFFLLKFVNSNDSELKGSGISVKPNQPVPAINTESKQLNPIREIAESKKLNRPVHIAKKEQKSLPPDAHTVEETIMAVMKEDTTMNEEVLVKVEPEEKAPAQTPEPTAKKKLRVIHINELGQVIREDVIMAQRQRSGSIYLQIGNRSNTLSEEPVSLRIGNGNSRIVFNPTN